MFIAFIKNLPVGELPAHNHTASTNTTGNHSHTININNTGSSQSHNNMQPYLAVYMWKRVS